MILKRIFSREEPGQRGPRDARVPDGERVYAIGDIHGCDDLFADLIARIEADNAARGPASTQIVLLGDLVDRGPSSREVVERAIALSQRWPTRWLIGNHEEVFLHALGGDLRILRYFLRIGGATTIHSYGIGSMELTQMPLPELSERLTQLVPENHVDFLDAGEDVIAIGDYLFVHAGIRPGVPIDEQNVSDLRWIREEFLDDKRPHGRVIVHGHTIFDRIQDRGNRIGIDTGAYATGRLTALGLEGADRWYLQTEGEGGDQTP
jgi:serine/threonine protein phosphatase 1